MCGKLAKFDGKLRVGRPKTDWDETEALRKMLPHDALLYYILMVGGNP